MFRMTMHPLQEQGKVLRLVDAGHIRKIAYIGECAGQLASMPPAKDAVSTELRLSDIVMHLRGRLKSMWPESGKPARV